MTIEELYLLAKANGYEKWHIEVTGSFVDWAFEIKQYKFEDNKIKVW